MSLLNKATIITTPTAHSNGTLHSIKGGEVADFDVVRGSAATRVNAEGLIEDISLLSGELVTNGDFSNGSTDWTLGTGWSIGENKAICEANGGFDVLNQGFVLNSGNSYKVTYTADLSLITSGTLKLGTFGNSVSERTILDGTNTAYLTASGTSFAINEGGAIGTATITNISVIEITDATNIPRIDYTTGEGVVLLEPQSTNLITYSEDFSNASWSKSNSTITSNDVTSPDGTQNAALLADVTSTAFHRVQTSKAVTSGVSYSQSVFVKKGVNRYFYLGTNNFSFWDFTFFDLENNVAVNTPSGVSTEVEVLSNGWVRLKATKLSNATGFFNFCFGTSDNTTTTYTGDSTGKVHIYGAQFEALPYATSYIPTSGAIATRLADSVTGAGDVNTFNSTEGVLYAEIAALVDSTIPIYISLSDGTLSNRISILLQDIRVRCFLSVGGVMQFSSSHTTGDGSVFYKIAVKYKENDFALWVNGVEVVTDNAGVTPSINTINTLQFANGGGVNNFEGKVKALAVFNEALTDSELECLTTI